MLSDEERKAIDYLQLCYNLSTITNESLSKLGIVLNLIEKQSKEIEDYIENKELINQTLGLEKDSDINKTLEKIIILNNYEDKIKAKINELEEKLKIVKNSTLGIQIYDEIREQIKLLYLLLEKED